MRGRTRRRKNRETDTSAAVVEVVLMVISNQSSGATGSGRTISHDTRRGQLGQRKLAWHGRDGVRRRRHPLPPCLVPSEKTGSVNFVDKVMKGNRLGDAGRVVNLRVYQPQFKGTRVNSTG